MADLVVTDRQGQAHVLAGQNGLSIMEIIRDAGLDELLALCGGSCSCATCHVIVAEDWLPLTGRADGDEEELLDSSDQRTLASRLSCQIVFSDELDGLEVAIAAED